MLKGNAETETDRRLKMARLSDLSEFAESISELKLDRTNLLKALADLHKLLEDYAPAWYAEEVRETAEAALQGRKQ
jgi:hypothetical protein